MTENHRAKSAPDPGQLERLAVLGEMFAEVVHEINNLMGAISGYAQLINLSGRPSDSAEYLQRISHLAKLGSELAANVLRFARPPAAQSTGDVESAVCAVLELYKHRARKGVRFVWEAASPLPAVSMPTGHLQLAIANLVKNALDATAHVPSATIRITARQAEQYLVIGVWNPGSALEPRVLRRLFTPFFTTKSDGRGTGLGLAVTRRLVGDAGGRLAAENPRDGGVLFNMTLPVCAERPAAPASTAAPVDHCLKGRRILIVDDDESVREVLRLMVMDVGGGNVEACASAEEALRLLEERAYDAVVLDLRMPGISGQEMYKRLPEPIQRRVVFVTGDILGTTTSGFLASTHQPALFKPLHHAELLEAVEKVVSA